MYSTNCEMPVLGTYRFCSIGRGLMGMSYETKVSILGLEGGRHFAEAYIHFAGLEEVVWL